MTKPYNLRELDPKEVGGIINTVRDLLESNILKNMGFDYGIVYNYDSIKFGLIDELELNIDNIYEAIFFNERKWLSFFERDCELKVMLGEDNGVLEESIDIDFIIKRGYKSDKPRYDILKARKYIEYNDCQAYISLMRPLSLVREA